MLWRVAPYPRFFTVYGILIGGNFHPHTDTFNHVSRIGQAISVQHNLLSTFMYVLRNNFQSISHTHTTHTHTHTHTQQYLLAFSRSNYECISTSEIESWLHCLLHIEKMFLVRSDNHFDMAAIGDF